MFSSAAALIKSAQKIATPPEIYNEINEVLNSSDSTLQDIADIVAQDPGVSARLLKIVNSAYYGLTEKIETVSAAVQTIGTRQLRDLVLATTVVNRFEGISDELINMTKFWEHSLATAIAARSLASIHREANLESFFVGGMLHDLGRLVLFAKLPEESTSVLEGCKDTNRPLIEIEAEIFGFDHTDVGRELFKSWNLPAALEEVAGCHHHPQKATTAAMLASTVHCADIIVHAMGIGRSGEVNVPQFSPFAWAQFGMVPTVLTQVFHEVDSQFSSLESIIKN